MHRTVKNCKSFGNCLPSSVAEPNAQFAEFAKLEQASRASLGEVGHED